MAKTSNKTEESDEWKKHFCGECARCEPYMRFETLTVKEKKPTMGTCPKNTERKVLLSEKACKEYKHKKIMI